MNFDSFRTEYLVIIETKGAFCNNLPSFNNLLKASSDIHIKGDKLTFRNISVNYKVQTEEMNEGNQRYFHIILNMSEPDKITVFEELQKNIRVILAKATNRTQIQILWDDVSFYYANKAYPLIYEIENLMRKLITKFMLTNVGGGWTRDNIPDVVKDSIRKKRLEKQDNSPDYLYETDFIQLANFLFVPYQTKSTELLMEKLKSISTLEQVNLEELKSFIPKSNWDRHFSDIVTCEHEYLKKRWDDLYELRCRIAHNNRINREDFNKTERLVAELKDKLQVAIENLDKINISSDDKENIAESLIMNTNEAFGWFVTTYKAFEEELFKYAEDKGISGEPRRGRPLHIYRLLFVKGYISKNVFQRIDRIRMIRNHIVHESDVTLSPSELNHAVHELNEIIIGIRNGKLLGEEEGMEMGNFCAVCGVDNPPGSQICVHCERLL